MRIAPLLMLTAAVLLPVTANAYTTTDSTTRNIVTEHQNVISAYAQANNKTVPSIVEYRYGMTLDIARVIRQSPDLKTCEVTPKLMTYENSMGELQTLKYQVASRCQTNN